MALLAQLIAVTNAAVEADLVTQIPGYNKTSFKVYSGYLSVPGPFQLNDYDELSIHYQFHLSQNDPTKDPVATWHQGGPGGSSFLGLYTEMGYFQVSDRGEWVNENAWNKVANMLYFDSPAGSNDPIGFSTCSKGGKVQGTCHWDDKSQAEAYAHTLKAFFTAYPEFESNDLYLTGESYAGQYVPNIANWILNNPGYVNNLKGFAVGNACWGGDATTVQCNGPNSEKNDMDLFYGKGLVSKKLRDQAYSNCGWNGGSKKIVECAANILSMDREVGPHNVYDIYDNCPGAAEWEQKSGRTTGFARKFLRDNMHRPRQHVHADLTALSGGYPWPCGGEDDIKTYLSRDDVRAALHLGKPGVSRFSYRSSGPASITLYPSLVKALRVLIYNGDADSCVPYTGNEEWTTGLAAQGVVTEKEAWRPWYATGESVPAGYVTSYTVANSTKDFSFLTIRLAGHMVPTFQPHASFSFISRFFAGESF